MEGIALTTEFIGSIFAYLGSVALLAFVVSVVLFGYMAEEESKGNRLFWAAFASGLLLLYAMVLFLSPDPEWTMWAAQMAMGVLYVPDPPTLQGMAQGEAVRAMSAAGALGSLAVAALLALRIKTS